MIDIEIGTQFIIGDITHTVKSKCRHPNYKGWYSCLSHKDFGKTKLNNFRGSEIQENLVLKKSNTKTMMTSETKERLQASIKKMQQLSSAFYAGAVHAENHAFIEFSGLINEYIEICKITLDQDIDFTKANIHCGQNLVYSGHNESYLREKLECIYGTSLAKKIIPESDRAQGE
jgi:hypothetical protein